MIKKKNGYFVIKKSKDFLFLYDNNRIQIYKVPVFFDFKKTANSTVPKEKADKKIRLDCTSLKALDNLVIDMADGCNLNCKYCYANGGTYNMPFSMLSFDDLKKMYSKLLLSFPNGTKKICFFGGEPLLSFKSIQKFVEYLDSKSDGKIEKPKYSIVTNGTLINNLVGSFFKKYNFVVSVSLDGPKSINDINRVYKNSDNKSSYDAVIKGLEILRTNAVNVIGEATLSRDFFYKYKKKSVKSHIDFFINKGFKQFFPFVVEDKNIEYSIIDKKRIRYFYEDFFNFWLDALCNPNSQYVKFIPGIIYKQIHQICSKETSLSCKAGKTSLFYGCNKNFYKCQMFYQHGNEIDIQSLKRVHDFEKPILTSCKNCISKYTCSFWCEGSSKFIDKEDYSNYIRCFIQNILTECILKWLIRIDDKTKKNVLANLGNINYEKNCF